MRAATSLLAALMVSGCASLLIDEDDGIPMVAAKVSTRFVVAVPTLFTSEIAMARIARDQDFVRMMDAWIGNMTYDDALSLLGPPSSSEEGSDIFVAVWDTTTHQTSRQGGYRKPTVCPEKGFGSRFCIPDAGNPGYTVTSQHGEEVRLVFDKNTMILKNWNYRRR